MEFNTPLTSKDSINNFRNKIGRSDPDKIIIKLKNKNKTQKKTQKKPVSKKVVKKEPDDDMVIILTNYMKHQNIELLNQISEYKGLSNEDRQQLINDYLKIGFYTPTLSLFG